ncbi:MAG: 50S ribosomal protein L13 [Gemmatimonadota bacterium]|nr:MAG: 50S ribosomal protein L13 [Gemmatimonadota bacterium]
MKTHVTKGAEIQSDWHVIDADGVVLGRLACEAAALLRGKHKPNYCSNLDGGDHVIIVNAAKIVLTGNKLDQKMRYRHTGFPGGLKATPYRKWMAAAPEEVVRKAVKGMLPSTRLGRAMLNKVKIYAGAEHPHAAQVPQPYVVKSSRPREAA